MSIPTDVMTKNTLQPIRSTPKQKATLKKNQKNKKPNNFSGLRSNIQIITEQDISCSSAVCHQISLIHHGILFCLFKHNFLILSLQSIATSDTLSMKNVCTKAL